MFWMTLSLSHEWFSHQTSFSVLTLPRQQPAHALDEDIFDQTYFSQQRELIIDAYSGVRTLRLLFANHLRVKGYEVPVWLYKGEICTYQESQGRLIQAGFLCHS